MNCCYYITTSQLSVYLEAYDVFAYGIWSVSNLVCRTEGMFSGWLLRAVNQTPEFKFCLQLQKFGD